ncbi:MAG: metallophosphoesterase [Chitinophagaceae bacterium]|nr:metallophosphoesterase [Chitinophagaceae bacterium]
MKFALHSKAFVAVLFASLLTCLAFSQTITRGPYLQMATQTAITIRWRTSAGENSKIELGTSFGTYPTVVTDPAITTEHIIRVTGLTADTKYYYRIGNSTNLVVADAQMFFTTVPPGNTIRKIRIAAFGDCGRGNATYQDQNLANYQNYLTTNGIDAPDAWILLGDNAYNSGTDLEYTNNFFGIYGSNILKNHKLFPAPGNHDYGNNVANKPSRVMPYYNNFSMPQLAECGGVASNKPNYYSYDIGNIHFLSLDSWGTETTDANKDMGFNGSSNLKTWINNDLAANTRKWIIAYWHHPPYTKASHNSDSEAELAAIRQNFITYLEARGVDMIICGHSHGYERSYLLRNFTGGWTSFVPANAVSMSSAKYDGSASSCPYIYNTSPANHGTVYVVAGSAGASGGIQTNFGAYEMPFSVNNAGIFYFEVEGNRLDAKMLRSDGTVFDRFTIMKDINTTTNYTIINGSSLDLTASWPQTGNYTWTNTTGTSRTVSVTPPDNATTLYTVADGLGCVLDQFNVNTSATLAVSLLMFEARLNNIKVDINWSTVNEHNNKFFTIERSANGRDFSVIGTVNSAGNSSSIQQYSMMDYSPLPGTSYYRLSQTSLDDHKEYLRVKQVINIKGNDFEVKAITPGNGLLSVQINSSGQSIYQLRIYDLQGRERRNEMLSCHLGVCKKEFTLEAGMYIYEVINNKSEKISQKVLIK